MEKLSVTLKTNENGPTINNIREPEHTADRNMITLKRKIEILFFKSLYSKEYRSRHSTERSKVDTTKPQTNAISSAAIC